MPGNMEFDFTPEIGDMILDLTVEGAPVTRQAHGSRIAKHSSVPITSPLVVSPSHGPEPLSFHHKGKSYNVRVAKGSVEYTSSGKMKMQNADDQLFVDITEETANVNYIMTFVKRKWGERYMLCTSDGLPIEDSSGTQGIVLLSCKFYF